MSLHLCRSCAYVKLKNWYFSVYFNPKVWAIDWHRNTECCKFWAIIGPFEINRVWTDRDVYPFQFEEEENEDLH